LRCVDLLIPCEEDPLHLLLSRVVGDGQSLGRDNFQFFDRDSPGFTVLLYYHVQYLFRFSLLLK
jgi:hypothetical protein